MGSTSRTSNNDPPSQRRQHSSLSGGIGINFRRAHSLADRRVVTGATEKLMMRGQGTSKEDEVLLETIKNYDEKQKKHEEKQKKWENKKWKTIMELLKNQKCTDCIHKFQKFQKFMNWKVCHSNVPWTREEDEMLYQLVNEHGTGKWSEIAQFFPGRKAIHCSYRWRNYLDPQVRSDAWTQEEDLVLIHYHDLLGNRWASLTNYLPGRTNDAINQRWYSLQKKKLDSYINSGLLAQFKSLLPHNSDQPILPSSIRIEQGRIIYKYQKQQQPNSPQARHTSGQDSHTPPNNQDDQLHNSIMQTLVEEYIPVGIDQMNFPSGRDPSPSLGVYQFPYDQLEFYCQKAGITSTKDNNLWYGRSYSTSALNPNPSSYSNLIHHNMDPDSQYNQDFRFISLANEAGPSNVPNPATPES